MHRKKLLLPHPTAISKEVVETTPSAPLEARIRHSDADKLLLAND